MQHRSACIGFSVVMCLVPSSDLVSTIRRASCQASPKLRKCTFQDAIPLPLYLAQQHASNDFADFVDPETDAHDWLLVAKPAGGYENALFSMRLHTVNYILDRLMDLRFAMFAFDHLEASEGVLGYCTYEEGRPRPPTHVSLEFSSLGRKSSYCNQCLPFEFL
jgi:hypothetical protein